MDMFTSSLGQMAFLFLLIATGFLLVKCRVVPSSAGQVLAKLENTLFIPALAIGTFMKQFTVAKLSASWQTVAFSTGLWFVLLPLAWFLPRLLTRDGFTRRIYTYGLAFANFGFMGNAVVASLFPDLFLDYLLFTIPLLVATYAWAVPALLIPREEVKGGRLKALLNPMFIGMAAGMVLGLADLPLPGWLAGAVESLGGCMSPVAMLLTGITVAAVDVKTLFGQPSVYILSTVRLLAIPLAFLGVAALLPVPDHLVVCATAVLAMPLGLNTIVVPSAYGKDPTTATGMALISHLMACATIPVVFALMMRVI